MNSQTTKNKVFYVVGILSILAAMAVHFYLTRTHFALKYGTEITSSLCNINDKLNCDAVSLSPYASLWDIPVAIFGLFSNFALLIVWIVFPASNSERALRHSLYISTFILAASVVMGGISLFFMKTYCLFCMFLYLLSILTFICVYFTWKERHQEPLRIGKDLQDLFGAHKTYLALYLFIPLASFAMNDMQSEASNEETKNIKTQFADLWEKTAEQSIATEGGLSLGASEENAKMHIIEFADFNCIHCKHAAPVLHAFTLSHPEVRLTFMNFPLDGACNPKVTRPGQSCTMVKSVYCANQLGGDAWALHKTYFASENPFSPSEVMTTAVEKAKVPQEALRKCMDDPETLAAIEKQAMLGDHLGVEGTPTIFINGKKAVMAQSYYVLSEILKRIQK